MHAEGERPGTVKLLEHLLEMGEALLEHLRCYGDPGVLANGQAPALLLEFCGKPANLRGSEHRSA